jgi:hypothetical protein
MVSNHREGSSTWPADGSVDLVVGWTWNLGARGEHLPGARLAAVRRDPNGDT